MTRRDKLIDFIDSIYFPVSLSEEKYTLLAIIRENDYRGIEEKDANKQFADCLIIETKGRGARESYSEYRICRVDVGEVGPVMADIAVYNHGACLATPKRVKRNNIRFNIPA